MTGPKRTNAELEAALLGALLLDNNTVNYIPRSFSANAFHYAEHQVIYSAIQERLDAGQKATPVTLKEAFPQIERWPEGKTASQYMAHLAANATSIIMVTDYALELQSMAHLREIDRIAQMALSSGAYPQAALVAALAEIDNLRTEADAHDPIPVEQLAERVIGRVNDQLQGRGRPGVLTGLRVLDNALNGGYKPGELIVVGARPGIGKTTFAASTALSAARLGSPVGFLSLEMPGDQLGARILSDAIYEGTGMPYSVMLHTRHMSQSQMERLIDAKRGLAGVPLAVDESSSLSLGDVAAKARKLSRGFLRVNGKPLAMLVIDYLKMIRVSERYRGNRNQEIGEVTGGLKKLAKDMGIAIVLLHQLNRETEKREDKRPTLADLRDSGEIEADADVVLLLYRESYYLRQNKDVNDDPSLIARLEACANEMEINIAKQRMGAVDRLKVFVDLTAGSVRDLDWQTATREEEVFNEYLAANPR